MGTKHDFMYIVLITAHVICQTAKLLVDSGYPELN